VRLQCDAAGLTDFLASDSVVYGRTIFGGVYGESGESAEGRMTRGYGGERRLLSKDTKCWQLGQGWGSGCLGILPRLLEGQEQ